MKSSREKRGQFVIIAVMLMAIMIVSIGTLMHGAITYYRHEPWEEYSTLIGDIEINSRKLVELSLADYTNDYTDGDKSILSVNLEKWKNDLADIYPSYGIVLANSTNPSLSPNPNSSKPTAEVDFTLSITTIGLKGYTFSVESYLHLAIGGALSPYNLTATVTSETGQPVTGLGPDNFMINGRKPTAVSPLYRGGTLIYGILLQGDSLTPVEVWDQRGIRAQA